MKKQNFLTDNEDISFHIKNRMDFDALFKWTSAEAKDVISAESPEEYRDTWLEVLDVYGAYCGTEVSSRTEQVEKEDISLVDGKVTLGPTMTKNIDGLIELGTCGLGVSAKYGGMSSPFMIEMAGCEIGNRACPSTMLNAGWWGSIASIIKQFGTEELCQEYIPKIATGEYSGNMALTEPDAGSDLANIRTYGEEQEDGTWILNGTKRFISNGNSHISLVLAKNTKGGKELSDLSLYLCPAEIDGKPNIIVSKIEEKIGLHGSATCELVYDNSRAFLLGKNGEGFRYMLRLMNDSRIGVSFQALGLMEATQRLAADYASQRKTWGKPIAQHELVAEKLLDLEVETKAFRSICYQAAYNRAMMYAGESYLKDNPDLPEEERSEVSKKVKLHYNRVRRWTPLIKYWAGEKSAEHARACLQIHGGYGFSKEYKAEWWMRESLIYSLYEGTSQIQALMCMKDTLKEVVNKPKEFFENAFGLKVKIFSTSDSVKKKLYKMKEVYHHAVIAVVFRLMKENLRSSLSDTSSTDVIKMVRILSKELVKFEELRPALIHAERICEIKTLVTATQATVWDMESDPSRRWIAERMVNKYLPRVNCLKAEIDVDDSVIAGVLSQYDSAEKKGKGDKEQA